MEHNLDAYKSDAEIILELLKIDTNHYLNCLYKEGALPVFIQYFEEVLEDKCAIRYSPIYVRGMRYILQFHVFYQYLFPPVLKLIAKRFSEECISAKDLCDDEFLNTSSYITSHEFYMLLTQVEDEHIREAIGNIKSDNPIYLFDNLYESVCNKDINKFTELLISNNADISFAAQYLRTIHAFTRMFTDWASFYCNEENPVNESLIDYYENETKKNSNLFQIDYGLDKYTNEACNELGDKVSSILIPMKDCISECIQDPYFKNGFKNIVNKECWDRMHYCFKDLPNVAEEDFLENIFTTSLLYRMQKSLYFNTPTPVTTTSNDIVSEKVEVETETSTESEKIDDINNDEIINIYNQLLLKRTLFTCGATIDALCIDYLAKRIKDGNDKIEEIKYVFFRIGTKPLQKLVWTSEKQDIACLMKYMFKRKPKEIWEYLDIYIVDINNKPLFTGTVNPSSSAKNKHYQDFKEKIELIFKKRYNDSTILNDAITN